MIGFIGWESAVLSLIDRFGPLEIEQIRAAVGDELQRDIKQVYQPPHVPEHLYNPPEEDDDLNNDFDTTGNP